MTPDDFDLNLFIQSLLQRLSLPTYTSNIKVIPLDISDFESEKKN